VINMDDKGYLVDYIEKPDYRFYVSMGIYVLSKDCLQLIKDGEVIGMPNLFLRIKDSGSDVFCYPANCYWMDIGRVDDYDRAHQDFEANSHLFHFNCEK